MTDEVRENTAGKRFELVVDGHTAHAEVRREPGTIVIVHTEVPPELGGRGVGSRLLQGIFAQARVEGTKIKPLCPFAAGYMNKHPEYNDIRI